MSLWQLCHGWAANKLLGLYRSISPSAREIRDRRNDCFYSCSSSCVQLSVSGKGQTEIKSMAYEKWKKEKAVTERERDNVNLICPWTQWLSLFLMYYENMKLCGKLVQNYFYIFWDLGTKTKHITIQWSFFKNLFTKLGNWNHLFSGIVFTSLGSRKIDHKFHFCSTLNDPQNKTYAF